MKAEINGKEIGFSNGLYFIGKAQRELGYDLFQLVEELGKNTLSFLPDLMWLSIRVDAELDDKQPAISKREFIEYLENSKDLSDDKGIGARFVKSFSDSIKVNLPVEESGGEDVKKK